MLLFPYATSHTFKGLLERSVFRNYADRFGIEIGAIVAAINMAINEDDSDVCITQSMLEETAEIQSKNSFMVTLVAANYSIMPIFGRRENEPLQYS